MAAEGMRLAVVGREPGTALGLALAALGAEAADVAPDALSTAGPGALVIGAAAPDALRLAEGAATAGWHVLLEPLGDDPDALAALVGFGASGTAGGASAVLPALRRRHEPDCGWARSAVAAGAMGLPWGVQAEVLVGRAADPLTEAVDLLDALEHVTGVRATDIVRIDAPTGPAAGEAAPPPLLASLAFEHGVIGHLTVRTVPVRGGSAGVPGRTELASLRVTGSHGTALLDLDAPLLELVDAAGERRVRSSPAGADRLLALFRVRAAGGPAPELASMADAARLLRAIVHRDPTDAS